DGQPLAGILVVVKGSSGQARETNTDSHGHYSIPVSALVAPYFVEAGNLHAAVLKDGIADATPLSDIAFTEIVTEDPHHYFVNLDTTFSDTGEYGDGSSNAFLVTAASVSQAETAALRFIHSVYGLSLAAGTGDLFTADFEAVTSDPM